MAKAYVGGIKKHSPQVQEGKPEANVLATSFVRIATLSKLNLS